MTDPLRLFQPCGGSLSSVLFCLHLVLSLFGQQADVLDGQLSAVVAIDANVLRVPLVSEAVCIKIGTWESVRARVCISG